MLGTNLISTGGVGITCYMFGQIGRRGDKGYGSYILSVYNENG